ncbi:MAG: carbohydrate kinase family protein [Pseudomonadota bacterium]
MILSCGEALIDMLPRRSSAGEAAFAPYAGGAVFNTAIALGRLGVPSGFFSGLSTDLFGALLAETLAASKVDLSHAVRSGRPTTLAFVTLRDGHATYAFYDENTAGRMLSEADLPKLPAEVTALFFGGISLVNDPAASTYETLQSRERGARPTMIDPNFRALFVDAQEALNPGTRARYMARVERMMAAADIVKLADEEIGKVFGEPDLAGFARRLVAKGPKVVFVTEGAKGARAITATENRFVPALRVTVADTVGAGDTFNAGVLASFHNGGHLAKAALAALSADALDAALTMGVRAAAVTVSRPGADPPWAHELA